jgi:hypothetical protein
MEVQVKVEVMENRSFDWAGGGETIVNRNYSTTMAKKLEGS